MITAEQCKKFVEETGITEAPYKRCSICSEMTFYKFAIAGSVLDWYWLSMYELQGDELIPGYDPGCGCCDFKQVQIKTWGEFAETFNIQPSEELRLKVWENFINFRPILQ